MHLLTAMKTLLCFVNMVILNDIKVSDENLLTS